MNFTADERAENLLNPRQTEADLIAQAIARKDRAVRLLDPGLAFSDYRFRWIFDSIRALLVEGSNVDLMSVAERLREHPDVVSHPDGSGEVAKRCLASVLAAESISCTDGEFDSLLSRCKNATMARQAQKIAAAFLTSLSESPSKVSRHLETIVTELARLASGTKEGPATSMNWADAVAQEAALIDAGKDREGMLQTPIDALNRSGGESFGGQFIVVAARPGAGKTTFLLQWLRHIARTSGKPVYFEEGEMAIRELARRGICSIVGKPIANTTEQDRRYAVSVAKLEPTLELCCAGGKLKEFEGRVHLWMQLHPDTVAIGVDYLGLLQDHTASSNVNTAASEVSDRLKCLAQQYQIVIIACQQPNRNANSRADKAPVLGDIRDSAKLEQDAHKIFFLARPCEWDKSKPGNLVELHLLKNRDGPTGVVELAWSPETFTFSDWDDTKRPLREGYTADGQRRFPEIEEEEIPFDEFTDHLGGIV